MVPLTEKQHYFRRLPISLGNDYGFKLGLSKLFFLIFSPGKSLEWSRQANRTVMFWICGSEGLKITSFSMPSVRNQEIAGTAPASAISLPGPWISTDTQKWLPHLVEGIRTLQLSRAVFFF